MFQPLKVQAGGKAVQRNSFMAQKGINLRDSPQLMGAEFALSCINYFPTAEGHLVKREGYEKMFDVESAPSVISDKPVAMLEKSTDDIFVFGYATTVAVYEVSTDTVTSIKTDFSANSGFSGVRYGDYFFVANGVDKVWRIDMSTLVISEIAATQAGIVGITAIGARMFAWKDDSVYYSAIDDGSNPPFDDWTIGTAADEAGVVNYRRGGNVQDVISFGDRILVLQEFGKFAFFINTLEAAGVLSRVDVFQMSRLDLGGSRGSINTPVGVFYLNEGGLSQLVGLGQPELPMSDQEMDTTVLLGSEYFEDVGLDNVDLVYDSKRKLVLVTMAKGSAVNNRILAYNVETRAVSFIKGWNISRFINVDGTLYGGSALSTSVYKLFTGSSDDDLDIETEFYQEIKLDTLDIVNKLDFFAIQGLLSDNSLVNISFDIYDKEGRFVKDKARLEWTAQHSSNTSDEYGSAEYGISTYGGDLDLTQLVDCFNSYKTWIRSFMRLRVKITSNDKLPHSISWFSVSVTPVRQARFRHLTKK